MMVRQQKNQLGVDEPALLRREVAMDVDQGFVEAVRVGDIQVGVQHGVLMHDQWRARGEPRQCRNSPAGANVLVWAQQVERAGPSVVPFRHKPFGILQDGNAGRSTRLNALGLDQQ